MAAIPPLWGNGTLNSGDLLPGRTDPRDPHGPAASAAAGKIKPQHSWDRRSWGNWEGSDKLSSRLMSLKSRVRILVDGTLQIFRLLPEDSGNFTCVPTNGLLTPPTASAILTVMHPAKALQIPEETYLPTGMGGGIRCPVAAQPPLRRVDWIKDGAPLDLSLSGILRSSSVRVFLPCVFLTLGAMAVSENETHGRRLVQRLGVGLLFCQLLRSCRGFHEPQRYLRLQSTENNGTFGFIKQPSGELFEHSESFSLKA
ncbi:hypothetical protein CCH79_00000689 [Gambusia affinis]|uniref:Ig-like domain-containing protein n=1 Tax=Gambusia affinis TaxID=33528 RepID=A0A315VTQ1_GAMAF|nr:hypothetical protein CCH79_00000689 [Gambusia affinis]